MRAVTISEFGEPDVMQLSDVALPELKAGEVLVKVKAIGINRADLLQRKGKYPPPPGESDILGLELSGEVAAIADDVNQWAIRDRVCALVGSGAYAEYCAIDAAMLMPIPEDMSFEHAAAIPEAFLTATQALMVLGDLGEHQSVLIHAGASGVGTAAVQLAKTKQARVFFTVSNDAKMAKVVSLGGDVGINYKQQSFHQAIMDHTDQRGVDVILDFIGAGYFHDNLNSLALGGRLVCIATMQGSKTELDIRQLMRKRLQIKGLIMRSQALDNKRQMTQHFVESYLPMFSHQQLHPVVDTVFPIEQVAAAHQYMQDNKNIGKIILTNP